MTDAPVLRITPDFLSDPAVQALFAALPEARIVGGAVRDAMAGRPVADIDLATPQLPQAVVEALKRAGIRSVPTGFEHGTVTAVLDGRGFEVTTLRRDIETDGRHAVVSFTDDWQADAARRDFTINAMSMNQGGAVFDYFGGADDLRNGILRFVGDPGTRIAEDYLRLLRFFRFFARYAGSPPEGTIRQALRGGIPGLAGLSVERIWSELSRILVIPDPRQAVRLMAELGVLDAILPEGADPAGLEHLVQAGAPADPILRLAAILGGGDALHAALRLKLSTADRERLLALRGEPTPRPTDDYDALRRLLADTDPDVLTGRTWLRDGGDPGWTALRSRLGTIPRPVFPLAGRDVIAAGIAAGPRVGEVLRQIRDWWIAGGCKADAAACQAELRRLLRQPSH